MQKIAWLSLFLILNTSNGWAQESANHASDSRISELENKLQVLAEEVQKLQSPETVEEPTTNSGFSGLAPAASKVYRSKQGVSIGGYGEMLYQNFAKENESELPSGSIDQIDFLRAIVYVGYKFNPNFVFNSEIEFEHADTGNGGGVSVEFAYLDYLHNDALNFRAGLLLIPMGFLNELHEPPIFLGSKRTLTETFIIPSTFREAGLGVYGSKGNFDYKLYLVNSFDGLGTNRSNGFSEAGLRGGRQKGSRAAAENFASVIRVDYTGIKGLMLGASNYFGKSGQSQENISGNEINAYTSISEAHVDFRKSGIQFRGLFSHAHIWGTDKVNAFLNNTTTGVAEDMIGYYAELGYDVLRPTKSTQNLIPFFRYEHVDTQDEVSSGLSKDLTRDQKVYTAGVNYKPINEIVLKGDYQWIQNKADTGVNQWNLALGYLF